MLDDEIYIMEFDDEKLTEFDSSVHPLVRSYGLELGPVNSIMGGFGSTEVIKLITGKYSPISQWFTWHDFSLLPKLKPSTFTGTGIGSLFGQDIEEKLKGRTETKEKLAEKEKAEKEFVEAACLIAIVEKKEIPSDKKLAVMPESYVLGLLDCVGELKRRVFDEIRIGDIDEATRVFEVMENLYLHLYTFSMYDKVVKEARRKIDVNRILVDDVRSAITEEKRRAELIKALQKLEK